MRGIIVDSFAGGGGASTGIELAGFRVDEALNHDPVALAMHEANHPWARHHAQDIRLVHPRSVTMGRHVLLLWASPDCKHFSKAKGGRPLDHNIRDLATVVLEWAESERPSVIGLENVEEFVTWGPLDGAGRPIKERAGEDFRAWVELLQELGYQVEWRELRACDFGAPTSRKRLFILARCDGRPIVWPKPTHGPKPGLLPYRTAAECIDWTLPVHSIFMSAEEARTHGIIRPLKPKTMARIARGVKRFLLDAAEPFIVPVTHHGDTRVHAVTEPLRTVTGANRGELAVITPFAVPYYGEAPGQEPRTCDIGEPLDTVTTAGRFGLVVPFGVPRYGEREGQEPRCQSFDRPLSTIVPTQNGASLVAAFLAQHNGGVVGHACTEPVSTICQKGSHQALVTSHLLALRNNCFGQDVREPAPTVCASGWHVGEVRAFLTTYYGTDQAPQLGQPLPTATTRDRFGLVVVQGVEFQIVDIGMRMLSPRELFNAQGFPADYIIDPVYKGKPLTRTAQVKCCGNSVCPPVAAAIVRANLGHHLEQREAA